MMSASLFVNSENKNEIKHMYYKNWYKKYGLTTTFWQLL